MKLRVKKIQKRFSSLFRGWKAIGDERIILFEELDGVSYDPNLRYKYYLVADT